MLLSTLICPLIGWKHWFRGKDNLYQLVKRQRSERMLDIILRRSTLLLKEGKSRIRKVVASRDVILVEVANYPTLLVRVSIERGKRAIILPRHLYDVRVDLLHRILGVLGPNPLVSHFVSSLNWNTTIIA